MKKSVIREIFYGNKGSRETMKIKPNKQTLKAIADGFDKLKKRFSKKQIEIIEKFLNIYDESWCDEVDTCFIEGFKLGLRIGVECFEDNEQ